MQDIKIHIPAIPVAQPRPRVVTINGQARAISNPAKHPVTAFKATCRMAASQVYSGPPLSDPLAVTMLFVMPRPKNMHWKTRPMPRVPHAKRPDGENLAKAVQDALEGILWADDAVLYDVRIKKVIASGDEQPHVEVIVWKPEE